MMSILNSARALTSAYSAVTTIPTVVKAVKEKDKEHSINASLSLAQSISYYIQTRAALFTGISTLSARLLSYEFTSKPLVFSPLAGGIIGAVCCSIDGMIEAKGIFYCDRFLKRQVSSHEPHLFHQFQNTAKIQNPLEKKQVRTQLIERIIQKLEPTPFTQKITAVYKRVLEKETPSTPLWGWAYQCLSLVSNQMSYEELERQVEIADWLCKLQTFKASHFKLTQKQLEKLEKQAEKKHPHDVLSRRLFKLQRVQAKEEMKTLAFQQCVGETYTKKIQNSIDSLLTDLISTSPTIQNQALSDTKKLTSTTQTQVEKMRLIHIVGLIGAIVTTLSFVIALCVVCGPILPIVLGVIGTIIYLTRYLLARELMENEGWKFSLISSLNRGFILPVTTNVIEPIQEKISKISLEWFKKKPLYPNLELSYT